MQRPALLLCLAILSACEPAPPPPDEVDTSPAAGRAVFEANCVACHGTTGRGDGPAAVGMRPRPADLTRLAAANGGTFPWARVMSQVDGYTRTGPREVMPDFGAGFSGATVPFDSGDGILTPTPVELVALANYVMSLQR